MNAADDVLDSLSGADVVDDLGFSEHGADARNGLGVLRLEREGSELLDGNFQVMRGALQKPSGAGGALVVRLELLHPPVFTHPDGPRALPADVEDARRVRKKVCRPLGGAG